MNVKRLKPVDEDKIYEIARKVASGQLNYVQYKWWQAMLNVPAEHFHYVYQQRERAKWINRILFVGCLIVLFCFFW